MRSPCEELAAALVRTPLDPGAVSAISAGLDGTTDWERVLTIAAAGDVEPVVLSNLRSHFVAAMPGDVGERVAVREREARGWALARSLMVSELAGSFARAGIPVIVLKGPAVSLLAYGNASLRQFSDVDLLVRPRDLASARDFLFGCGFARTYDAGLERQLLRHGHALELSDGRNKVELHDTLFPYHLRLDMDSTGVWEEAIALRCGEGEITSLSRHHLFLYLCAHGTKHMWGGMRWIADLSNLLARMTQEDARRVMDLSRRTHTKRILAIALRSAAGIPGTDISVFPQSALESGGVTPPSRITGADENAASLLYWTASRERRRDRIASYARVLFIPTEKDRGTGPVRWIHRPLRLGLKAIRRAFA